MKRREDTPVRITHRKYEESHKEERKATNAVWGTSMRRDEFNKLNKFLEENNIKKVDLIYAGWHALEEQLNNKNTTE
jgi:hypothetical protein